MSQSAKKQTKCEISAFFFQRRQFGLRRKRRKSFLRQRPLSSYSLNPTNQYRNYKSWFSFQKTADFACKQLNGLFWFSIQNFPVGIKHFRPDQNKQQILLKIIMIHRFWLLGFLDQSGPLDDIGWAGWAFAHPKPNSDVVSGWAEFN